MRIALGTAQFGMNYGITNNCGQVSQNQAIQILDQAHKAGFDTLDTAVAYGGSEQRLGELGVHDWKVISKIPALPASVDNVSDWVYQQVRNSLKRIGIRRLDGLLMHNPSDILGTQKAAYVRSLRRVRDEGLARSIGYSIYSADDLYSLTRVFQPDIVQAPFNIIDRRILTSGWLSRLADDGVRIHTRSAFLQGLLLISSELRPAWFDRWANLLDKWDAACNRLELTPLQLALEYVLAHSSIERIIVGVDNVLQLIEIIEADIGRKKFNFPELESNDIELIEPSRWNVP